MIAERIPTITAGLVLIVMGCAFVLSFVNLQATAIEANIPWILSWLFPLTVDAVLICGSLFIYRSNLAGESAIVGWSVLIVFTVISSVFNVLHSPSDLVSRFAHLIPPVALCITTELFMMTLHKVETKACVIERKRKTSEDIVVNYFIENPTASVNDAAKDLSLSRTTINRYKPAGEFSES